MNILGNIKTCKLEGEYRFSNSSLEKIIAIQSEVVKYSGRTVVNLTDTKHISPLYYPVLFSLCEYNPKITFVINADNKRIADKLNYSGVFNYYLPSIGNGISPNYVEYTKITSPDAMKLLENINKIFELLHVNLSQRVEDALKSNFFEIYINSITHGKNPLGTFHCGYYDNSSKQFKISIYDYGIGIPKQVNTYLKSNFSSEDAIKWALFQGNSTKNTKFSSGAGLHVIESFIKANNGKITICSGNAICKITDEGRTFKVLNTEILGTLFIIIIKADKSKYVLA